VRRCRRRSHESRTVRAASDISHPTRTVRPQAQETRRQRARCGRAAIIRTHAAVCGSGVTRTAVLRTLAGAGRLTDSARDPLPSRGAGAVDGTTRVAGAGGEVTEQEHITPAPNAGAEAGTDDAERHGRVVERGTRWYAARLGFRRSVPSIAADRLSLRAAFERWIEHRASRSGHAGRCQRNWRSALTSSELDVVWCRR
jgi:hypothetical protein